MIRTELRRGVGLRRLRPLIGITLLALSQICVLASSLEIVIRHTFNGEPLQLGAVRYQNAARESFSVTRVSYLLSGFALEQGDGLWLEFSNTVAWVDVEKGRASLRVPEIPPGLYRSLRFHVGLEESVNHANPAQFTADHPLNPNLNGLHWNWQGGYIFLALEGHYLERRSPTRHDDGQSSEYAGSEIGAPLGFSFHLARDTNCARINLPGALELTGDTRMELDFDLAPLFNAPRPISFAKDGSSTHSRDGDPVAAALVANLPGAFRVRRVVASEVTLAASYERPLYLPEKFTPYRFTMSAVFPIPDLPRDNPLTVERVALGEKLFHEPLLSRDGTISCASCHDRKAAFSDSRRYSVGTRGRVGTRQAMPLFNLAWKNSFFWDGRAPSLRAQALMPIQDHAEMDESLSNVVAKLSGKAEGGGQKAEMEYASGFTTAFGSPEITPEKIGLAIESFILTLTSFDSKFDRAFRGEAALTDDEKRGFELFTTEYDPRREQYGADCFHCHGGALFQSQTFANNGLDARFMDMSRAKITGKESDAGKFATPSLRNIALTAPYMHDGRFATLEEVVEHYSTGVKRSATLDPNLAKHPDGGLHLKPEDQRALVAFLRSLTDEKFCAPGDVVAKAR
jgi:cytochrome c peroxidase